MKVIARSIIALAASLAMVLGVSVSAQADTPSTAAATAVPMPAHDQAVSSTPVSWTPHVLDGKVTTIAQVGNTMIVAGNFSQVAQTATGTPIARTSIFAFNATTGQISTTFNPTVVNGLVQTVVPGPTAGTVFVGGSFSSIAGVSRKLVLLNATTGQPVSGFTAPVFNSQIRDMALVGNRLYVGGNFTTVGGQPHLGLVSVNATTGARESFLSVQLTENHNYTGQAGQAQAAVGAVALAVDANATTLAVVGNFRKADSLDRDQMVLIDISGATAQVRSDWRTQRYQPACASWAFDTYMRDVAASPDGSYFTVATTGAANAGTLCDTLSRWDVSATGDNVQPSWFDATGGDTLLSTASSGAVVYAGGHQRWQNNSLGSDFAGAGAVPRPGLSGFHADWGLPVEWNPGRNPRGVGAEALLVTDAGLWVGSDTIWIGDRDYRRSRLAFFPTTGGQSLPAGETGALPSNVYLGGTEATADGTVGDTLFRVNAGGPQLAATDGGPNWLADDGWDGTYRTSGSNAAGWDPVGSVTGDVPAGTPSAIYSTERWSPNDTPAMRWSIPVASGESIMVRLYFANRCSCTSAAGSRVFDVSIDGVNKLNDYDIVADVGDNMGTVKEFPVSSDGSVDIEFTHVAENPLINAIEIVEYTPAEDEPTTAPALSRVWFDGGEVENDVEAAPDGGIDWANTHGAVVIDGFLYYIEGENFLKRSFDGETYGTATAVDPYNDPKWADVATGSGTSTYRGAVPSFYGQLSSVRGLAFEDGLLYYTRSGMSQIFVRKFVPGSDVMAQTATTVPGFSQGSIGGIFIDTEGGYLYFSNTTTGTLSRIAWDGGTVSGTAQVVSGPAIDGVNWSARALFLADGPAPQVNEAPEASFTFTCTRLECEFDASESIDSDGSITSYGWDFGDGTSGSGETVTHEFTASQSYQVQLTVTDNKGATNTTTTSVEVVANVAPTAEVSGTCTLLECSFSGAESDDADGSVVDFAWDFGDGSEGTGEEIEHTYTEPGEYEVSLTVTDDSGATGSDSMVVTVDDAAVQAPQLVSSNATNAHSRTSSVAVPSGVQAGDVMLLFVTSSNVDPVTQPSGGTWQLLQETVNGTLSVRVFGRVATGSESGSVSFTWPAIRKVDLTMLVYRDADLAGIDIAEASGTNRSTHTSPQVSAEPGQVAVSFWSDRGSNALTWTAPSGVDVISTQVGTGSGRVSSLVAEADVTSAGPYGGLVATTSDTANRVVYLTLVVPAAD